VDRERFVKDEIEEYTAAVEAMRRPRPPPKAPKGKPRAAKKGKHKGKKGR
jgi:hypothetical protein